MKIYHTSVSKITKLGETPLWFAFEADHAIDGWAKNSYETHGRSFVYEAIFTGKLAIQTDNAINELFENADIDIDDYATDLTSNPSPYDVMSSPGTQLLIQNGYDAFQHDDYDPRDFSKDLESIVVFNPVESISGFSLIH